MKLFNRLPEYGIKVWYTNGSTKKFWYKNDRDKRNNAHNLHSNQPNVKMVRNIER